MSDDLLKKFFLELENLKKFEKSNLKFEDFLILYALYMQALNGNVSLKDFNPKEPYKYIYWKKVMNFDKKKAMNMFITKVNSLKTN